MYGTTVNVNPVYLAQMGLDILADLHVTETADDGVRATGEVLASLSVHSIPLAATTA
jgi:hypothetical protein